MTRLTWNVAGERLFEVGVDRGVLYVDGLSGVAWHGLVSVEEASSGGDLGVSYFDGQAYRNRVSPEKFAGTITAFMSPKEFDLCDGNAGLPNGLMVTRQRRKSFGLSYRTLLGNDVDGLDLGYKLHLIYNAVAIPSETTYTSMGSDSDPTTLSWDIVTRPAEIPGFRNSAHLVIDSTEASAEVLAELEKRIYGDQDYLPYLPTPQEVYELFDNYDGFSISLSPDGIYTITSIDDSKIVNLDAVTFRLTGTEDEIIPMPDNHYTIYS